MQLLEGGGSLFRVAGFGKCVAVQTGQSLPCLGFGNPVLNAIVRAAGPQGVDSSALRLDQGKEKSVLIADGLVLASWGGWAASLDRPEQVGQLTDAGLELAAVAPDSGKEGGVQGVEQQFAVPLAAAVAAVFCAAPVRLPHFGQPGGGVLNVFLSGLRRSKAQTLTSEGRSEIRNSGSGNRLGQALDAYQAQPAGGDDFVAVSASEVFFSREGEATENVYGKSIKKPREVGSLFNPYWQVRLIQSDAAILAAQALQGAPLP